MKVLLTKFVKGLGREGDIVEVSDGYAVNALFPKKLAKPATGKIVNTYLTKKKSEELRKEKEKKALQETLSFLNGKTLIIHEKVNPKGKLYHTLGVKEIMKEIQRQYQKTVPEKLFQEKYSLKESGSHTILLGNEDSSASLIVSIVHNDEV